MPAPHKSVLHRFAVQVQNSLRLDDRDDLQPELARESEIALVVRRHSHDGASAVGHQHVVGDPDRDVRTIHRVCGICTSKDTRLFLVGRLALNIRLAGGLFFVNFHFFLMLRRSELLHQRMFRREHHESGAPQRIRPGGKDLD